MIPRHRRWTRNFWRRKFALWPIVWPTLNNCWSTEMIKSQRWRKFTTNVGSGWSIYRSSTDCWKMNFNPILTMNQQRRKVLRTITSFVERYTSRERVVRSVTINVGRNREEQREKCSNKKMTITFGMKWLNCDEKMLDWSTRSKSMVCSTVVHWSIFFSLTIHEKLDLQAVEINEQTIVIDELKNEIQLINDQDEQRQAKLAPQNKPKSTDDQQRLVEELDKKLYELETERTCLIFEHERLKTNLDLCIDEKQHLSQQRTQTVGEVKKLKLRILALQDQIHKLKRNNLPLNKKNNLNHPATGPKRKIIKKSPKKGKSCLEMLLDQSQSATFMDDLRDQSSILYRMGPSKGNGLASKQRHRACSLCDHHTETSLMKRRRRPSMSSAMNKKRC